MKQRLREVLSYWGNGEGSGAKQLVPQYSPIWRAFFLRVGKNGFMIGFFLPVDYFNQICTFQILLT